MSKMSVTLEVREPPKRKIEFHPSAQEPSGFAFKFPGGGAKRFSGGLLLLTGLSLLFYLAYNFFSWDSNLSANPSLLGAYKALSQSKSGFGDLLENEQKEADPGLILEESQLNNFGALLGLQTQTLDALAPSEFFLSIPKLQIDKAKVLVGVDGTDKKIYLPKLKEGIAHFKGTALPNEPSGNVFLFGHSMLPILANSSYESIFTHLPKLQKGDRLEVELEGKTYDYEVTQTAVIDPTDIFVLKQSKDPILTLMTCIPPGFGSKRFVAMAKRLN